MDEKNVTISFPIDLYNKLLKISAENKSYNNLNVSKGKPRRPDKVKELIVLAIEKMYSEK